jgi:hypothetical protein
MRRAQVSVRVRWRFQPACIGDSNRPLGRVRWSTSQANPLHERVSERVSDGTRTRDRLDHNQELYLLSYAHHVDALSGDVRNLAVGSGASGA